MLYDSFRQPKGEEKLGRKANAGIPHDGDKPINAGRHPLVTPDSDVAFSFDLHKPTVIRHSPLARLSILQDYLHLLEARHCRATPAFTDLAASGQYHHYHPSVAASILCRSWSRRPII